MKTDSNTNMQRSWVDSESGQTGRLAELKERFAQLDAQGNRSPELVDVLVGMAQEQIVDVPSEALEYAEKAHAIAQDIGYERGVAYALGYMGWARHQVSNHADALRDLTAAINLLSEDDKAGRAEVLGALAGVHRSIGNYEEAFTQARETLKLYRELGNPMGEAWTYYGYGGAYHDFGDYQRSLELNQRGLELFEQVEEESHHPRAMIGISRCLNGIGHAYQGMGQYDRALEYHERALKIAEKTKIQLSEARILNDMGEVYQARGELERALECHTRALELRRHIGNRQATSTSLINLGRLCLQRGELDCAEGYLTEALAIAEDVGARPKVFQAHQILSELWEQRGDPARALEHFKNYERIRNDVVGEESQIRMRNLEVVHEVEKSQRVAEIERLRNVELKEKNEELSRLLNELKEAQTQLVQSEKMAALGSLVAGLAHEMNTPLGVLNSATDTEARSIQLIRRIIEQSGSVEDIRKDARLQRALEVLDENITVAGSARQRLTKLVDSLRSFVRLDEARLQSVDLHEGIESALALLEHKLTERITVEKEFGKIPRVTCYPGELNQVFMNLLSNALDAINDNGTITIRTSADNDRVTVQVSDTGVGINPEQIERLFDPGFSRSSSRIKAGMGLFASYNIMQKHNGDIHVTSKPGKGSTFTISIPKR